MEHEKEYYTKLKTYEIFWNKFAMGFDMETVRNMVYNPCIMAKQKIVFCDGKEFMRIKVTEDVMDAMRKVLDPKHIRLIREAH